jgi:hypothetical protein
MPRRNRRSDAVESRRKKIVHQSDKKRSGGFGFQSGFERAGWAQHRKPGTMARQIEPRFAFGTFPPNDNPADLSRSLLNNLVMGDFQPISNPSRLVASVSSKISSTELHFSNSA